MRMSSTRCATKAASHGSPTTTDAVHDHAGSDLGKQALPPGLQSLGRVANKSVRHRGLVPPQDPPNRLGELRVVAHAGEQGSEQTPSVRRCSVRAMPPGNARPPGDSFPQAVGASRARGARPLRRPARPCRGSGGNASSRCPGTPLPRLHRELLVSHLGSAVRVSRPEWPGQRLHAGAVHHARLGMPPDSEVPPRTSLPLRYVSYRSTSVSIQPASCGFPRRRANPLALGTVHCSIHYNRPPRRESP